MRRPIDPLHLHMGCGEALTARLPLQRSRMTGLRRGRSKCVPGKVGKDRR